MRRPIVPVCGGFVSGTVTAYFMTERYGAAAACALIVSVFTALLAFMYADIKKESNKKFILFTAAFTAAALIMCVESERTDALAAKAGQISDITGTVLRVEEKEKGGKYRLLVCTDDGSRTMVTLTGTSDIEACSIGVPHTVYRNGGARDTAYMNLRDTAGCRISLRALIELTSGRRNPKCFDYRLYLRSKGVQTVVSAKAAQAEITGAPEGIYAKWLHAVSVFKNGFCKELADYTDDEGTAILIGMLFGEKDLIDEEIYAGYKKNGTAHVLAVSGLHVGALYACISKIIRKRRRIMSNILIAALLLTYAAMAGFSPSVMRASAMILIHIAADILHRRYDILSSACLCILVTLIKNPFALFDTGFQLSYIAVITIAIVTSAAKYLPHGGILSFLSVQLGTVPLTLYIFNYFSLGAFIANVPVIFIAGITVPAGMLALISYKLSDTVFSLSAGSAVMLCDFMTFINKLTYMDGMLTFDAVSPSIFFMIMYYGIVLGGLSETALIWYSRRNIRKTAAAVLVLTIIAFAAGIITDDGFKKAELVFVDVGQGDCLHIKSGGRHYLVDGGGSVSYDVGEKTLKPYLLKNGARRVETAFVSHLHTDHFAGIASLCRSGMVKYLCIYEGNMAKEAEILEETGLTQNRIIYVKAGDRINLAGGGSVLILSPESTSVPKNEVTGEQRLYAEDEDDENKNSLIMRVECGGISALMNGDISAEAEKELVTKFTIDTDKVQTSCRQSSKYCTLLTCDILKAAHHGSKYSSCDEFVNAVSPEIMIFQVGKNNYGHPDKSIIEKCRQKGIMIYRNDESGAVGFYRMSAQEAHKHSGSQTIKAITVRKEQS